MKKTLIALAVAASAAVSGSAMAWTASGLGSPVDLGGTLTPADIVTPWEVAVGNAVTDLDAAIEKGQKTVSLTTASVIPVLGIRNANAAGFAGGGSINPQIDYGGHVDISGFSEGKTTLTLPVKNTSGDSIGSLKSSFWAAGILSYNTTSISLYAKLVGQAFYGGLGQSSASSAMQHTEAETFLPTLFSGIMDNWVVKGSWESRTGGVFDNPNNVYHSVYGSGIPQSSNITITLDSIAREDVIEWRASLPVTVTYM